MPKYTDVENFSKRTIGNLNEIMRVSAITLFKNVILKTPVDSGRARGNWQCTIGKRASGTLDVTDKTGSVTIQKMVDIMSKALITKGVFLTNNLPYIQKLEYGGYNDGGTGKVSGGFSIQAPEGMVRISLKEIENDLPEIIESAIRKGEKI